MHSKIILVTGGARSGKSSFAENLCSLEGEKIGYIATAEAIDDGMIERIKRHQERRPDSWDTFEKQRDLHLLFQAPEMKAYDIFLLDCLTVLTTNLMLNDPQLDWDSIPRKQINEIEADVLSQVGAMLSAIENAGLKVVIVTNEVGLGIVPENRLARVFRDIAGKVNELVAAKASEVHFVVSGIPMKIKG